MTNYNIKRYRKVRTPLLTWASALGLSELESGINRRKPNKTSLIGICSKIWDKVDENWAYTEYYCHIDITSFQQVVF